MAAKIDEPIHLANCVTDRIKRFPEYQLPFENILSSIGEKRLQYCEEYGVCRMKETDEFSIHWIGFSEVKRENDKIPMLNNRSMKGELHARQRLIDSYFKLALNAITAIQTLEQLEG